MTTTILPLKKKHESLSHGVFKKHGIRWIQIPEISGDTETWEMNLSKAKKFKKNLLAGVVTKHSKDLEYGIFKLFWGKVNA